MPQVRYNVQSPPLPANWRGNLRSLHQYLIENLQVLSGEATSSFVTGPNPPATDVGPWLAYDKSWRVWNSATNAYVAQFVEMESLNRLISFAATAPLGVDLPSTAIWVSGSGPGTGLGFNQWDGSAWVPVNLHLESLNTRNGMVRVGADRTTAGNASVELWAQNGVLTAQLLRNSGTNGDLNLINTGTGDIRVNSGGRLIATTAGVDRWVMEAGINFSLINGTRLIAPSGGDFNGNTNFNGNNTFNGPTTFNQGIAFPSGTTGARPASPAPYATFYDTTISALLYFKPGFGWVTVKGSVGEVCHGDWASEAIALQFNPGWEIHQASKGRTIAGHNGAVNGLTDKAPGDTFGEEKHVLTVPELASHAHDFHSNSSAADFTAAVILGTTAQNTYGMSSDGGFKGESGVIIKATGGNQGHNNIQPTIYFITLRKAQ